MAAGSQQQAVFKLAGHLDSVICCTSSPDGAFLASGAEDGRLCIHDLQGRTLTHTLTVDPGPDPEALAAVAFHPTKPHLLFAAAGTSIHHLDLRKACEAVASCSANADEVVCLAVQPQGSYLAAADDAGDVQLLELQPQGSLRPARTIPGAHSSLCSSVLFRRHKPWEVVTGGLDARVAKWDFSRGKRLLSAWAMQEDEEEEEEDEEQQQHQQQQQQQKGKQKGQGRQSTGIGGQRQPKTKLCNPPFVHCLAAPDSNDASMRRIVAAARGDGAVAVFDVDTPQAAAKAAASAASTKGSSKGRGAAAAAAASKRTNAPPPRGEAGGAGAGAAGDSGQQNGSSERALGQLQGCSVVLDASQGGHTRPVSTVCFLGSSNGRWLASGGEDGLLLLWDWTRALQQSGQGSSSSEVESTEGEVGAAAATSASSSGNAVGGEGGGMAPADERNGGSAGDQDDGGAGAAGGTAAGAPAGSQEKASGDAVAGPQGDSLVAWRCRHRRKVNALCGRPLSGGGERLYVADTSKAISVYQLL